YQALLLGQPAKNNSDFPDSATDRCQRGPDKKRAHGNHRHDITRRRAVASNCSCTMAEGGAWPASGATGFWTTTIHSRCATFALRRIRLGCEVSFLRGRQSPLSARAKPRPKR